MTTREATAHYDGLGRQGTGRISTQSGLLDGTKYGFGTRFGDEPGTNPEELIAAAHAGCFTMALAFALDKAGFSDGTLETVAKVKLDKDGEGFAITQSHLRLTASVPGIDADQFATIANDAKANCPVSKLLKADIALEIDLH